MKKDFFKRKEEEQDIPLSYSPVLLSPALRRRKYEEEQRKKYGLKKTKSFDLM